MHSRPLPHVGDVAPGLRTIRKKEGGRGGCEGCEGMGGGKGGGWPKAMALAAKGGPTRGTEKICLPLRNTNNRKKKIPNWCSTDSAQKENVFRISYCAGPAWPFSPPAGLVPRYMGIYITTEGTTQARDNRNQGRGAAPDRHCRNNPNTQNNRKEYNPASTKRAAPVQTN